MPASIAEISTQKTAPAALRAVTEHMFESEQHRFLKEGQPAGHMFYDVLKLTKAGLELGASEDFKLSVDEHASLDRVLDRLYGQEHEKWKEAGRPDKHVFVDLLVLGREQIKHKAMQITHPRQERECDTDSAALRGALPTPVTEAPKATKALASPVMG